MPLFPDRPGHRSLAATGTRIRTAPDADRRSAHAVQDFLGSSKHEKLVKPFGFTLCRRQLEERP